MYTKSIFTLLIFSLLNILQCYGQEQSQNEDDCVCVPYYQCEDGKVITTGDGLFDVR